MSAPNDTHALTRSLQALAESTKSARSDVTKCLEEFQSRGVGSVADQLVLAAQAADMPGGRARSYGEEYQAAMKTVRTRLTWAEQLLLEALDRLGTAEHIATVLPARCQRAPLVGGEYVLRLDHVRP